MPEISEMKPVQVSRIDLAFGGDMEKLLPDYKSIPLQYRDSRAGKWSQLYIDWMFRGIKKIEITPKEGIDKSVAMNHLGAIMASFQPSSEHKEAAVAYLASLWFEDIKYEVVEKEKNDD